MEFLLGLAAVFLLRSFIKSAPRTPSLPDAPDVPDEPSGNAKAGEDHGAAVFWMHVSASGWKCVGWCDRVEAPSTSIKFYSPRILDLSQKGDSVTIGEDLEFPVSCLKHIPSKGSIVDWIAHAGLVLYHCTVNGILEGNAGAMMFPGKDIEDSVRIRNALRFALDARFQEGGTSSFWNWLVTLPGWIVDNIGKLVTGGEIDLDEFLHRPLAAGAFTLLRQNHNLYQFDLDNSGSWGEWWTGRWRGTTPFPVNVEISPRAFEAGVGER